VLRSSFSLLGLLVVLSVSCLSRTVLCPDHLLSFCFCDGFGNSDNLRRRLYERKPKGKRKGVLRLVRSLMEFGISSRPRAPAGIQSPKGKEGEVGTTTYRLVGPNSQATAQKHNGCPICLGGYALRLGTTPKGLTEAGVRSSWLARRCCGWELAREGGEMIHTVLRAGV